MKQEMQLVDSTENPSPNIIKLCDALKTIPPTSVEAEKAFSAAGLFVTKLRTRLRDKRCPRFIRKNIRDRRHHKKSDLQSNQYCKRLHSPLGGDVHKSISVNRPALLQSFVLSYPKEDRGTFYKHRVCRHAPDLRINRRIYRSTERFIVKGTRRKMQRTA
ncbi:hypothetical protein TNCV_1276641 [Trichonephila clavipes]|nr:hypothetical protein TNCV_1276641 [Trichonephila clavipes]